MSKHNKKVLTKEEVQAAIAANRSMRGSAISLNVDSRTFARIAKEYGVYDGSNKSSGLAGKFHLKDILNGLHPQYQASKLSKRLVKEGLKDYKCECCGITEWNGKSLSLELNHIDGDNGNHSLANLELICPNCHSQTDTYRSKNIKMKKLRIEKR